MLNSNFRTGTETSYSFGSLHLIREMSSPIGEQQKKILRIIRYDFTLTILIRDILFGTRSHSISTKFSFFGSLNTRLISVPRNFDPVKTLVA